MMTKNIDKKKYEKPSMKVYPFEQSKLLVGSDKPLGGPWPGGTPW